MQRERVMNWRDDAEKWGNALNEAGWKFLDVCPEKSVLLFNNCKPALREAILTYAKHVQDKAQPEAAEKAPRNGLLYDGQWVNIVNHADCYRDMSKEEAVNQAVKLTEAAIVSNLATPKPEAAGALAGEETVRDALETALRYVQHTSNGKQELLEAKLTAALSAAPVAAQQPAEYADADALIAHLDSLCDESDEKWDVAQAAIAGIRSAQQPETEQSIKADAYDMIAEALESRGVRVSSIVDHVTGLIAQQPAVVGDGVRTRLRDIAEGIESIALNAIYPAESYSEHYRAAMEHAEELRAIAALTPAATPVPVGGEAFGCLLVEEASCVPHVHPEYGTGLFFTEDAIMSSAPAQQGPVVDEVLASNVLDMYLAQCSSHHEEAPVQFRIYAMQAALEASLTPPSVPGKGDDR